MPDVLYPTALLDAMRGAISFESDEFGVMLLDSGYVPSLAHARRSDVAAFEVRGDGYRAGGAKAAVGIDLVDDRVEVTLGGARWPGASINARYAVYFRRNGGDAADDEIVAAIDFKQDVIATRGLFSLAESVLYLQGPSV